MSSNSKFRLFYRQTCIFAFWHNWSKIGKDPKIGQACFFTRQFSIQETCIYTLQKISICHQICFFNQILICVLVFLNLPAKKIGQNPCFQVLVFAVFSGPQPPQITRAVCIFKKIQKFFLIKNYICFCLLSFCIKLPVPMIFK